MITYPGIFRNIQSFFWSNFSFQYITGLSLEIMIPEKFYQPSREGDAEKKKKKKICGCKIRSTQQPLIDVLRIFINYVPMYGNAQKTIF